MRIYTLKSKWTELDYQKLLRLALEFESQCVLVARGDQAEKNKAETKIEQLNKWLIESWEGDRWPGTKIHWAINQYVIYKYHVDNEFIEQLSNICSSLWDWLYPDNPEDLSFLRKDGRPWFISIIHEDDAYFKLDDIEKRKVENIFGTSSLVDEGEDTLPDEKY